MFFDNDLDLTNQLEERPFYRFDTELKTPTGLAHGIQTIGSSLLNAPFFLIAHTITTVNEVPQEGGYSQIYTGFFNLGSVVYSFFGNILLFYALSGKFRNKIAFLTTITIFFSSSIFYYSFLEPSMSHAHSYFASSLLVYFYLRLRETSSKKYWGLMGIATGLSILVRLTSFVFVLLPILDVIFFKRQKNKKLLIGNLAIFVFFIIVVFSPQMMYWNFLYGVPIPIPSPIEQYYEQAIQKNQVYLLPGDEEPRTKFYDFSNTHILEFLFSENRGVFTWHPVYLFSIIGVYFLCRKDRTGILISIMTAIIFFIHASSWDAATAGGSSFGQRRIADITPFLAIGLAYLFEKWIQSRYKTIISLSIFVLIFWNFYFVLVFFWERLIRDRWEFSFNNAVLNNFVNLPIYLETQISKSTVLYHTKIWFGMAKNSDPTIWILVWISPVLFLIFLLYIEKVLTFYNPFKNRT
ncbi:glycosyltransferase family 39 protein [Nitrosopumilus sp. K4]|uniref:glycosyltransferase family 39 protein n=1 Tax=Nitrosopumilus sp. K4 TaxID=2795383 RepID=UPI001BA5D874|nr:glycosyltransferase family 39 protein [Nitrosopumilus sp. K4]QUC65017.1 glycosyltransferase family 39 protein [Nitrosopumilus sp. K4]